MPPVSVARYVAATPARRSAGGPPPIDTPLAVLDRSAPTVIERHHASVDLEIERGEDSGRCGPMRDGRARLGLAYGAVESGSKMPPTSSR